jgi:hypothetical protein
MGPCRSPEAEKDGPRARQRTQILDIRGLRRLKLFAKADQSFYQQPAPKRIATSTL